MARKTNARQRRGSRVARRGLRRGNDWSIDRIHVSDAVVGPDVRVPALEDVLRAIENAPRADDWDAVARLVVPLFPRARPQPAGVPAPLTAILPPGVLVGFGADIGPAFMTLNGPQLELLGVAKADIVAQALANLLARADKLDGSSIVHGEIADTPVAMLQSGVSIGSTLVLAPVQVRRLFGPSPMLFIAPMRDLLIGFPADVEIELAAWVFDEFASQDPNCLAPFGFGYDGERLTIAMLGSRMTVPAGRLA